MPYMNGLVVFPTFFNLTLNFQSFMIWATVSSWPFCYCCCCCWVYRASPFSPAKKYNQSDCFLRNLCADQEATVRIRHGTIDWFQIGKGVLKGCLLSPCLFNLYAEYIMRNARPFRYDLNQIPYDYTVKVRNRFKGLDLIESLKNYGWRFVTLYRRWWSRSSIQKKKSG